MRVALIRRPEVPPGRGCCTGRGRTGGGLRAATLAGLAAALVAWQAPLPAGAEPPPPRQALEAPAVQVPVTYVTDVFFEVDQARLSPAARRKLDLLVQQLKGLDVQAVHVVGHTDAMASDLYNERLSAARSQAVRTYLLARGLKAGRVQIAARGEAQPVDDNRTSRGRRQNRRVEVEVIGLPRQPDAVRPSQTP